MKHWLMALLMLSMSAAYAGSDSGEEKSPAEKKAIRKPVLEEGQLPWRSQLMGPQRNVLAHQHSASQDPDQTIQDLMAKISELEISNQTLITKNQVLSTNIQNLVQNKGLGGNNQALGIGTQDFDNQIARLNADLVYTQQELKRQKQANQVLGTQVANLESEKVNLESARISLKDEKSALSAEIVQLKEANQTLGKKVTDLKSINTTLGTEITQLKDHFSSSTAYSHSHLSEMYQAIQSGHLASLLEEDKKIEGVINLTHFGYHMIGLPKLPNNAIGITNFCWNIRKDLEFFEPYVVEDQAKAIRRLEEVSVPNKNWIQAYQDLYSQGYPDAQGNQILRLECKYEKNKGANQVMTLINYGNYRVVLLKLPSNFTQKDYKRREGFRQDVLDKLEPLEPYVTKDQAKTIRKLRKYVSDNDFGILFHNTTWEQWMQAYQDLYNQGYPDALGNQVVWLEYKHQKYKGAKWVIQLIKDGYIEALSSKLPNNFVQQSLAERNAFRHSTINWLQPYEPYVIQAQAEVIRRLREFSITNDQVNYWTQAYQDLYNQGYPDAQGKQVVRLEYKYARYANAERVTPLIRDGAIYAGLLKLPDNFAQQSLAEKNAFRHNTINWLQPYEPYVVEDQAKAIRRLGESSALHKNWIQAYKDFYNLGYPDAQGNQVVRLEYKYKK